MKTIDKIAVIFISLLIVYWLLVVIDPSLFNPIAEFYYWILDIAELMGYPGAFVVSFIGNATIVIPVPYLAVAFILGGIKDSITGIFTYDPILVGVISGVAATMGEITGYLLGLYGSRYVETEKGSNFLRYANEHPHLMPFLLFFLAVTPAPDDFLIVPLGLAKYPFSKVFIPQVIGKSIFLIGVAYAGRLGLPFVDAFVGSNPTSIISRTIEVVGLLLLVLMIWGFLRFDWEAHIGQRIAE
ncbi:hypothetical protein EU537_09625 [Candidatus Thorarchaeota archaeon]|nr:MAG: hypothetical protein EU537_09625 [Candidatus Thorarchaeota archaeon]